MKTTGEIESESQQIGVIIGSSLSDWQIIQRDTQGVGHITLHGRWVSQNTGNVGVRLVYEDTGMPVNEGLDWRPANTHPDGVWEASLERVPTGGLYRLETRFRQLGNLSGEWSERGDLRHFLGVGDIWVIAGQSNASGYGRGPIYDPPELGVHLFRSSMLWALATHPLSESTDTRHPVNREGATSGHAPWLHFARLLKHQLGCPIGLVMTSLGGSYLSQWNPDDPEPSGDLYRNMLDCVEAAGGQIRGIVWSQGETESMLNRSESYLERFQQAVEAWRKALGQPELPILIVQCNRHNIPPTDELDRSWSKVREALRQAARRIPGVKIVPTFDLPLSDVAHTSPAGNLLLAERLAYLALGGVYGQPITFLPPDLQTASAFPEGTIINLDFAPVTGHMDNSDPTANCFRVEDELGVVAIDKVIYPGGSRVQLVLTRAMQGRTVVHGAYGGAPACVPMDVERGMPMLGFYGAEVLC